MAGGLGDALKGLKSTGEATAGSAVKTAGWGLGDLLQPKKSGLANASRRGLAGVPGIGEQVKEIITSAPSGFVHFAGGVATDPVAAAATGATIGAGLSAETGPGAIAGGLLGGGVGLAGYGLKKLFGDSNADPFATTRQFAQSLERTAGRAGEALTGHNPYAEASKRGQTIGALVEDIANLSMVGGAGAKALDVGVGGAASRALEASDTLNAAKAAVEKSTGEAQRLASEAAVPGLPAELKGAKLNEALKHSQQALSGRDVANNAAANLAQATEHAGGVLPVYRGLHALSTFGAKGANLPAAPYTLGAEYGLKAVRALAPKAAEVLGRSDAGVALLGTIGKMHLATQEKVRNFGLTRQVSGGIHEGTTLQARQVQPEYELARTMNRLVPDVNEQQAAFALNMDLPHALAAVVPHVSREEQAATIHAIVDQDGKFSGVGEQGLKLAIDYAQGRLPADQMKRINTAQQLHREMNAPLREGFAQGRGRAPATLEGSQGEAHAANVAWQEHGTTPNPIAVGRAEARRGAVLKRQGEAVTGARAKLERAQGRQVYTDQQMRQPVRAAQADVEAAMNTAVQLRQQHPEIAQAMFPDRPPGPALDRAVADAVLVMRDRGIEGLPVEVQRIADAQTWSGPKPIIGGMKEADRLIRQGQYEGAQAAGEAVAARLTQLAEQKRAAGDRAGAAVDEARARLEGGRVSARFARAQHRIERATAKAQRAVEKARTLEGPVRDRAIAKAKADLERAVKKERSAIRSQLYDESNTQLADLADEMGGWFPSSHRKWLSRTSRGDLANVRHPNIDYWNRLMQESEMSSLVTRPPGAVGAHGALALDELAAAVMERHGFATEDEAFSYIIGRLNAAAELRRMANGLVGGGMAGGEAQAAQRAAAALMQAGHDPWIVEHEMMPMLQGTPSEAAARVMQGTKVETVTPEMRQRVLAHVEAMRQAEREGGGKLPNRQLSSLEGGAARRVPEGKLAGEAKLTPFEQSLADVVLADARQAAAERGAQALTQTELRKVFDAAVARGQSTGRLEGAAAGLETGANVAQGRARTAGAAAEAGQTARMKGGVGVLGGRGFARGGRAGAAQQRVLAAAREVGVQERVYNRLDALTQKQLDEAVTTIQNAPARYRPALALAQRVKQVVDDKATELEKVSPAAADEYRAMAAEVPITLSKMVDQGRNPEYVIGGQVQPRTGAGKGKEGVLPHQRKTSDQYQRAAMKGPSSADEVAHLAAKRMAEWVRNETAHSLQARFGVAPAQVLARPADEQYGDLVDALRRAPDPAARTAAMDELRSAVRQDGNRLLEGEGNQLAVIRADVSSGQKMIDAMQEQGYVQWDPKQIFGKVPVKNAGLGTTFVPKVVWDRFYQQLGEAGRVEKAFRKYYDKPLRIWKDQVLALSPRWNVNNIVGGVVMATAGGGISPGKYVVNFARGAKIMRALHNEDRFAKLSAEDQAIARNLDPRLHQGSEAARLGTETPISLDQAGMLPKRAATKLGRGYKRVTEGSYNWNGFVDDANRLAVFLTNRERLTDRQLMEHVARDPNLGHVARGNMGALRDEVAVRLSLHTVGDFTRLTPLEKQVARRILPFYPWLRHITKLALSLPVSSPVRTAWLMHLSFMYGTPPEFGFLGAYVPIGKENANQEQSFLHIGNVNPFSDPLYGAGGGADYSPANIPANVAGSVSPALTLGLGELTGLDARKWSQITRPPGSGNLSDTGGDTFTPLIGRPSEALAFAGSYLPGYRVARAAIDGLEYGSDLPLRYGNGQVMKSQGQVLKSGRQWYSPATDLLGVPVAGPETISLAGLRARRDERLRRAAASRRRYAGTGTSTAVLPTWGNGS